MSITRKIMWSLLGLAWLVDLSLWLLRWVSPRRFMFVMDLLGW